MNTTNVKIANFSRDAEAKKYLNECAAEDRPLRGFVLIKYFEDGTQKLSHSSISTEELSFLHSFFTKALMNEFNLND